MKEEILEITKNERVGKDTYLLSLRGDCKEIRGSGQFASLSLKGHYLRRPLSIFDYTEESVTFLYKILGRGTKELSHYEKGEKLSVLLGLGNGFDTSLSTKPLLIGGGIGLAPLYHLGKEFLSQNKKPTFLLGFRNKEEAVLIEEYQKLGDVLLTSDDGSLGDKGNPVSYLKNHPLNTDFYYACGPSIMLKFLSESFQNGQVSLEARMGCGFGACMGCSIKTKNGVKRICKEGPVFLASEVTYE